MNQLVFIENNRVVTDSLTVAECFNKNHKPISRTSGVQNKPQTLVTAKGLDFIAKLLKQKEAI